MLPLKKVVLFKHGVGYFEREGNVNGDASIDLYFRALEMNDVLKSLTVLDLQRGVVTSISYESTLPVQEQLKDIAIDIPKENALSGLLAQLQGAHINIEIAQQQITGTVVGIETVKRQLEEGIVRSLYISVLVGDCLQSFDVMEAKQIKLLDENLKKDLQHLLDVLITSKKKELKKLTVFLKGQGEHTVNLSYVVETPVWKTSYRLLLNEATLLQGWALVDNTQDEDWEEISLSLVAGLPISFIHDLYSPRYQKRPVIQVKKEEATCLPPVEPIEDLCLDEDDLMVNLTEEIGEEHSYDPKKVLSGIKNFLTFNGTQEENPSAKKKTYEQWVPTKTMEVGDLFRYDIENPVTVRRQQSALVPIFHAHVEGSRVILYNSEIREKNPMSAVLFKNTTGLTLESGPVTVFEEDNYVGEAMLNTLKPDEEQLVPFSIELGCIASIEPRSDKQDVHQVVIKSGHICLYHYELDSKIYTIHNKTEKEFDLFIEHRFKPEWDLIDTPEPVERTEHFYRFRLDVPHKKIKHFTVTECMERETRYALQETSREMLRFWLDKKYIDKKALRTLESIVHLNEKISQIQRDIKANEEDIETTLKNQERLRKNLQALGSAQDERGLRERYIESLVKEENKLSQSQDEISAWKLQKENIERELYTQVNAMEFNVSF